MLLRAPRQGVRKGAAGRMTGRFARAAASGFRLRSCGGCSSVKRKTPCRWVMVQLGAELTDVSASERVTLCTSRATASACGVDLADLDVLPAI